MPNDIVYILKPDIVTDELRYSLRSLVNLPHRYVWFVCGQPAGFVPDRRLRHVQTGGSKWDLIKSSMLKVVKEDELSEEFYLFNDDFFVMKPVEGKFKNFVDKTLKERIEEFRAENPWLTPYARTLFKAEQELISLGCPTMNFDVHLPMLFEKSKVAEALRKCSSPQMRSVYGNIVGSPFVIRPDVKVNDMDFVPDDPDFLSTNDNTFARGEVGEYIRSCFTEPSRFEVDA